MIVDVDVDKRVVKKISKFPVKIQKLISEKLLEIQTLSHINEIKAEKLK